MTTFVAKSLRCTYPEEESSGIVFSWLLDNEATDEIRPIMKQFDVETFDPAQWYSTQILFDIAREIYKIPGPSDTFVAIGKKFAIETIADHAPQDPEDAIQIFNQNYGAFHRGFHPEQRVLIEKTESHSLQVINNTPWPGEMIYGAVYWLVSHCSQSHDLRVVFADPDEYLRAVIQVTW